MSQLSVYQQEPPAVVQQQSNMQTQAVQRLGEWAQSAIAAHEVATSLVQTSFVPEAFRGKAHEATAAILAGAEVGLSPMASLRSFDVIGGTAAARAITLRAIVQSQGHEMILVESTNTRARMKGKRRGSSEWVEVVWTMDRATALGLAGKTNWKNQPATMLVARCTSELARLVAADAILGIGYTVEELNDGADVSAPVTATAGDEKPATRRMGRKKAEPKADEPTATEEGEPLRSEEQSVKLHACLTDLGIKDRAKGLELLSEVVGRQVDSSKTLTKAEASQVIDHLEGLLAEPFPTEAEQAES